MTDESRATFNNPGGIAPPAGYTHAVEVRKGKLLFISGQVAMDSKGNLVGKGDYRAQAEQIFRNIGLALESVHASFKDLIKLNFYMLDADHLPEIREVRDKFVNVKNPPASTAVQVSRLFKPEYLLEIEAVASIE